MAYQTGTASDRIDLLDKLRAFALGIGWTIHRFNSGTDGWLALSHGSAGNFNLKPTGTDLIAIRGATGYDSGAAWEAQPGVQANDTTTNELVGPYHAYHFYGDHQYLHVVIEIVPGRFRHMMVGKLDKIGAWTGGEYACGTFWNPNPSYIDNPDSPFHGVPFDTYTTSLNYASRLRADIDGLGNRWLPLKGGINQDSANGFLRGGYALNSNVAARLFRSEPNTFNGLTPLLPSLVMLGRAGDTSRNSPAGHVPDLRAVNLRYIQPGDVLTIGTDEWQCWPLARRVDQAVPDNTEQSAYYGIAYRRTS